ncbi:unnamed protein product [Gongylonema pulchrum]|uniref:Uncharacterized protein n=1 Tax=Gongylonema pulchrum TaxID=637853 RepID=A0A183DKQ4_9BILA|nr:unnamed protein product [Gongylonema pulchrum]
MQDDLQTLDMYDSGAFGTTFYSLCCVIADEGDETGVVATSPSEETVAADGTSDGAALELCAENAETVTNSRLASLQTVREVLGWSLNENDQNYCITPALFGTSFVFQKTPVSGNGIVPS